MASCSQPRARGEGLGLPGDMCWAQLGPPPPEEYQHPLGWGTAWLNAYMSIGAGTSFTAGLLSIGYTGPVTNNVKSVLSVDGV